MRKENKESEAADGRRRQEQPPRPMGVTTGSKSYSSLDLVPVELMQG